MPTTKREIIGITPAKIVEFLRREQPKTAQEIRQHFQSEAVRENYPMAEPPLTTLWTINPYTHDGWEDMRKVLGIIDSVETNTSLLVLITRGYLKRNESIAYSVNEEIAAEDFPNST